MDTNDRMRTNIPSQKRRKRNETLLLNELNEAETEAKSTQNAVLLKSIGIKHRARRVQRPQVR